MKLFLFSAVIVLNLLTTACTDSQLPTVGRTQGDFPMRRLMDFDNEQQCYRFLHNVWFEASFADGMAYKQSTCLPADKKIGRKTTSEIAKLHVSLTYDGEHYIIKSGY